MVVVYNNPIGGVAAGFGGAAAAPLVGASPLWVALGAFALFSAALAVARILPKRER
ncbi:hypothetical protein ACIBG8_16235 [Nonomuraea sp. NPDC050556]|uniref:hypothetical protein n=1 Tax=Nonomuraea sp. NPDC050556 TaxID=3364369 RepID=UPI0037A5EDEB